MKELAKRRAAAQKAQKKIKKSSAQQPVPSAPRPGSAQVPQRVLKQEDDPMLGFNSDGSESGDSEFEGFPPPDPEFMKLFAQEREKNAQHEAKQKLKDAQTENLTQISENETREARERDAKEKAQRQQELEKQRQEASARRKAEYSQNPQDKQSPSFDQVREEFKLDERGSSL